MSVLVAVAHGSRDPRSAATVTRLAGLVRSMAPTLDVRVAFLDLSAPRLPEVLSTVDGDAVVVPLLLGSAYHARVDIPAIAAEASRRFPRLRVHLADVLGPDPRLEAVALDRLAEAGAPVGDPDCGVLLAATGSAHPRANRVVGT